MGRFFTIGFFVLLAVLIIVMSIPSFMDWNKYKGSIESAVGDATGRTVKIDGPVSFVVLPQPALTMAGVSMFADSDEPFLSLERLAGKIALAPLLRGQVRVTSLKITGASLTTNGGSALQKGAEEAANVLPPAERRGVEGFLVGLIRDVRVDSLLIEDFAIRQHGAASAPSLVIEDGAISFPSLDGPFKSETTVSLNSKRFRLVSELGQIVPNRATSVSVEGFSGDGTEVSFKGSVREIKTAPDFSGALRLSGKGLAPLFDVMHVFGGTEGAQAGGYHLIDLPMTLSGDVAFGQGKVKAEGLRVQLGETRAVMSADLTQGSSLEGLLSVSATKIDGDALMAAWAPASNAAIATPRDSGVEIRLNSDGVTYKDKVLRGLSAKGYLSGSRFQLATLGATAPGNTKIAIVSGALTDGGWQGDLTLATPNMRQLTSWLGMDVSQVSPTKLGTGNFSAKMIIAPTTIGFADMALDIDGNHYQGAIRKQRSERLSFGAKVSGDHLDLNDYGSDRRFDELNGWLSNFDANLELKITDFTGLGISHKSLTAKGKLYQGAAEVESLRVGGVGGALLTASGEVSNFDLAALKGKIDWRVKNWPSCQTLSQLRLESVLDCSPEEKVSLKGHLSLNQGIGHTGVRGTFLGAEVDLKANGIQALWRKTGSVKLSGTSKFDDLSITFDGSASELENNPTFRFDTKVSSSDGAAVLRRVGFDYNASGRPLEASGVWSGNAAQWTVENLQGSIGGSSITGSISMAAQDAEQVVSADLSLSKIDASDFFGSKIKILTGESKWSARTLKPLWPEDVRGTVALSLRDIKLGQATLISGSLKGQIDGGRSEWALYSGDLWGGAWTGKAIISRGRQGIEIEARGRGEQVTLAAAVDYFSNSTPIVGTGDLSFNLSSVGSSALGLAGSAKGSVGIESMSGMIIGMDVQRFERSLADVSGAIGVQLASEDYLMTGSSEYRNLVGEFKFDGGTATSSHWQSLIGGVETRLYIEMDTTSRGLKGDIEFIFDDQTDYPAIAYTIRGDLADPSGVWDTWSLEEHFAEILKAEQAAAAAAAAANGESEAPTEEPSNPNVSREVESGDLQPLQ